MKTVEQAIQAASQCLKSVGIPNARLESEFLVASYLQIPRTRLLLCRNEELPPQVIDGLKEWIQEREQRKPLAYVTGEQPFRDFDVLVTPDVLIPRPETELLVEQALRLLERRSEAATVVDVGTGSGVIALSLIGHEKVSRLIAIDLSLEALNIARHNETHISTEYRVDWVHGDLLMPLISTHTQADLIVANLPYVTTKEMDSLEPELRWEPRLALDGGKEGLNAIEPCIRQSAEVLSPGGFLLLEIGFEQSKSITRLLEQAGKWNNVQMFRDFAGLPRIIQAERKE